MVTKLGVVHLIMKVYLVRDWSIHVKLFLSNNCYFHYFQIFTPAGKNFDPFCVPTQVTEIHVLLCFCVVDFVTIACILGTGILGKCS